MTATIPSGARPPLSRFTREIGIVAFMTCKWARELEYRLIKEL